jgi:site-specific DNA recombinase
MNDGMNTSDSSTAGHRRVALYARVSSERQAEEKTIESQIEDLKRRIIADGERLLAEHCFIDNGYSGTTLMRPALERLRDLCAAGGLDRLYVHTPDRLSRANGQMLYLMEEWKQAQVEVVFFNHPVGETAEDQLLLQVQGVVAEYERAKILERCRRGRRYAAQRGQVSALAAAPYGYRYISKRSTGEPARVEVVLDQARIVRQIFEWLGRDRLSLKQVCKRLAERHEPTAKGLPLWNPSTVRSIARNPAYKGQAAYGKHRNGPRRPRLQAMRMPRHDHSTYQAPPEEWIAIPVPALVEEDLWRAVAEQLHHNCVRDRQRRSAPVCFLLAGLLRCALCGRSCSGRNQCSNYRYYRCNGTDRWRTGGAVCAQRRGVRCDHVDAAIWQDVCALLREPDRVEREYRRRLQDLPAAQVAAQASLAAAIRHAQRTLAPDRCLSGGTSGEGGIRNAPQDDARASGAPPAGSA